MRPTAVISAVAISAVVLAAACTDAPTTPPPSSDRITLSQAQLSAMTVRAQQVVSSNPGNVSLRSFVDSTLQALQAGVQLQRLDVTTDLTDKPLYFVGIHRVVNRSGGVSFSTWTLVGFEDPAAFANIVQTSGFAQSTAGTAPASLSGTMGDGTGTVNGQLLQVGTNGSVTAWNYASGSASFNSDAPAGNCPLVNPAPSTVCSLETMHVRFEVTAGQSATGSAVRHAAITTEVSVPAMRLTYTP